MRKSKVLSFVLVAALAVTAIPINAFGTVNDEKNKLSDLQNQKQQAQDENNKLQKSKSDAQEYIQSVDKKLTNLATEMYKTNQKLSKTEDKISKTQKELNNAQVSINEQYEDMKLRIKYMYENGDTQMIDLIFNSKSITDFLNKAEYITELAQYDRDMLNKMKKTKEKIASAKSTLVTEKKNLQTIQAQQKSDQTKLTNLSESKQQELKNYEDLIAHNEATSDELEAEISAQEKRVASVEEQSKNQAAAEQASKAAAEKARREAAAKKQQAASSNSSTSNTSSNTGSNTTDTSNSGNSGSSGTVSGGGFTWPLPGHTTISSGYGYRGSELHKGIDIPASAGTTIVAAGSGTVEWANYSTTAGNWIGINHGNGVYSVYMHMSALLVSAGTKVSAGQSIGLVGNTGASQGNHLHFAVRKNGAYVNPWDYLK